VCFLLIQVLIELTRQKKTEETVLVFDVMHLGTEATVRTYNLAAVSYLKKISLDYYETGGKKQWKRSIRVCVCVYVALSLKRWLSSFLCSLKSKCCSSFPVIIPSMQLSLSSACPIDTVMCFGLPPACFIDK